MNLHRLIRPGAMLLIALSFISPLAAQEDRFDDGNDAGWTHFAPLEQIAATTFSVSAGAYHLSCLSSPAPAATGPARAASLRQDKSYGNFCVMVDIHSWTPGEDASIGIIARVQGNPGPGSVNAYSFTWQVADGDVQISRITDENPADISGTPSVSLVPGTGYRMVFTGIGSQLEGRIYSMDNLAMPLVTATATDSSYTAGTCGLVVFSDSNSRASGGFDNYLANDGTPPPLEIRRLSNGDVEVSWDALLGLGSTLEVSRDFQTWAPAFGMNGVTGGRLIFTDPSAVEFDASFYRLHTGPPRYVGF